MKYLPLWLCGLLLGGHSFAQPPSDDLPPDPVKLDAEIAILTQTRNQKKNAFFIQVRGELEHPIQNPGAAGNYIIDCIHKVQFPNDNQKFTEWKKDNPSITTNHNFEAAANLHLRYLALTLKRATLDSAEPVQREVWDYLEHLNQAKDLLAPSIRKTPSIKIRVFDEKTHEPTGEINGNVENLRLAYAAKADGYVQDLLNGSVAGGLAAKALKVGDYLGDIQNWELTPGNFSGIMEQDIRTILRKKKDPSLVSTWDYEITYLSAVAKLKNDPKFEQEELPRLIWKKSKDVELVGMPNRALAMRIALVKQYPQHPDFDQWSTELSTELGKRKEAAEAAKKAATAEQKATPAAAESPTPATSTN